MKSISKRKIFIKKNEFVKKCWYSSLKSNLSLINVYNGKSFFNLDLSDKLDDRLIGVYSLTRKMGAIHNVKKVKGKKQKK